MNLRQKLFTTFGGLGLMVLLVASVTLWSTQMWKNTNRMLEEHYQRSLLVHQIEANVLRAVKEIPDALSSFDDDAEQEFAASMAPVTEALGLWMVLAHTDKEQNQVKVVRAAFEKVVADAQQIFALIREQRPKAAARYMEEKMDDESLRLFMADVKTAEASDRVYRQQVQEKVNWIRRTDKVIIAIAAFGTISLMLMLMAYLTGDLFSPLQRLTQALGAVAKGDYQQRLPVVRKDELGEIYRAFNQMMDAVAERQLIMRLSDAHKVDDKTAQPWQQLPSRITLHRLLSRLKAQVQQAVQHIGREDKKADADSLAVLTASLDHLLETVLRFAEFGFPLDLNFSRFNVRTLLYEVLLRFHEPFAQRAVGFEIDLSVDVDHITADRQKLREVLGEIIRNALTALPEREGHIGIHASIENDNSALQIEVADDGKGAEPQLINRAFSLADAEEARPSMGLAFSRAIIEQHGGKIMVHSQPGEGTYVRISLPLQ